MNNFTIGDIENLCGIKAHTLRIWEKRHNLLLTPKRKESNHRFYDNEDLKYLLRIAYLNHNGFKISKIAGMDRSLLQKMIPANEADSVLPGFFIVFKKSISINKFRVI